MAERPLPKRRLLMGTAAETATDVRPFQVEIPDEELAELRRRIEATRWPSEELVADRSQGGQLATLQALARSGRASTTGASARRD